MKNNRMKKWVSMCLALVVAWGLFGGTAMEVRAANHTIREATFYAQRLDVVCVRMAPLEEVYKAYSKRFHLKATDDVSGYYVNGERVSATAEYTEWGLHPSGTSIKGSEYAPGDYFSIIGTFTETLTNQTYDIELHMYCISGGGSGTSSTAKWEFLEKEEVPNFVKVQGFSGVDYDQDGAYAILELSETVDGTIPSQVVAPALRDGSESEIYLTKVSEKEVMVRTSDDTKQMKAAVTYTIKAGTKIAFGVAPIVFREDYSFYVSGAGFTESLPIEVGYKKTVVTADRHEIVLHSRPAVRATGTLGTVEAVVVAPNTDSDVISFEVKAGEVPAEIVLSVPFEKAGRLNELLQVGTELSIVGPTNISETLQCGHLTIYWNGSTWTDVEKLSYIQGDATNDDQRNVKDLIRYKACIVDDAYVSNDQTDLNKDGYVSDFDVTLIRRMLLGEEIGKMSFGCDLAITSPVSGETVYPYIDKVYQFLTTEGADIWDYVVAGKQPGRDGSLKDIEISWENLFTTEAIQYATKYVVEYATKADFSDAIRMVTDNYAKEVAINNLYKATNYYARVTAYAGDVVLGTSEVLDFKTTDIGPRVMTVDGVYNVRDLGGYMTESGKRTVQGLLYRGGEMDGNHHIAITQQGDDTMSNLMGIKYDMDFRGMSECNNVTESPISSAKKVHHIIGGYTSVFGNTYKEEIRGIFSVLANKNNYPLYYHCWGGADRTGTISFLINGLLGVSEKELVQDYEFTSYSIFGVRADNWDGYEFDAFLSQLKTYEGATLSKKIEAYLLSIGVTEEEIDSIKAIMFGEEPKVGFSCPSVFDRNDTDTLTMNVTNGGVVSSIYIEGEAVEYAFDGETGSIRIKGEDLPKSIAVGQNVSGKVVLANGEERTFSFLYQFEEIASLKDYWTTETGSLVIKTEETVSSSKVVGYGKKISMDIQTEGTGTNGGLRVAIGSYGVELRGSEFRTWKLDSTGAWNEVARNTGLKLSINFFDQENAKLIMRVAIEDNLPVLYLKAVSPSQTKEYTYTFPERNSNEIPFENAKVSFYIRKTEINSLTIQTGVEEKMNNLAEYWFTESGEVVLNSSVTQATSDLAVGYNEQVRIDLQTIRSGSNGSLYIMLGSYGVRLRAGTFRMSLMASGGSPEERTPRVEKSVATDSFALEGAYVILETKILSDTQIELSWKVVRGDGVVVAEDSYVFERIANEIASEDAKVTFKNDASEFSSVIIKVGKK